MIGNGFCLCASTVLVKTIFSCQSMFLEQVLRWVLASLNLLHLNNSAQALPFGRNILQNKWQHRECEGWWTEEYRAKIQFTSPQLEQDKIHRERTITTCYLSDNIHSNCSHKRPTRRGIMWKWRHFRACHFTLWGRLRFVIISKQS